MPLYECQTVKGTLSEPQRQSLAESITSIHTRETGAPASYVHVLFKEIEAGSAFTAGHVATPAIIRGQIRAGRPQVTRHAILCAVSEAYMALTGADPNAVVVAVVDIPASWAMEGGHIFPEPEQPPQPV
jgi:phenylpyruvate tautomerase PptA (4-oxalocrotonate tautomerase family)